jgi:hypothetical protein
VDSRLSGRDNNYQLTRERFYADLWYGDRFRLYAEFIQADSFNQDLTPLPIDRNYSDLLNLFVDVKLLDFDDHPLYFRGGRQELLYGSQRLISPLDWANTRRTFQGGKLFYRGDKLDVDAFVVQPVIPDVTRFDSVDNQQVFSGFWTTYRPRQAQTIDAYYLNLDNQNPVAVGRGGQRGGLNVSTFGGRYSGNDNNWLWDFEAMLQFGGYANQQTLAKAYTAGFGYHFKCVPTTPQFWVYYDYASGDPSPGVGNTHHTFNQLFPFGHYYFGYIDVVGRQNINDFNAQLSFYPTKWLTTWVQYHVFRLDSPFDALYNAAGVAIRRDPTGRAGTDVGDELDLVTNFHIDKHQDILIGYSHLWAGDFIRFTAPTPRAARSPDYTYIQYSFRF